METENWVTGNVRLAIGGESLDLQMTVPASPVKPQRMLPIFHQMTDSFVGLGVNAVVQSGKQISCQAGCGACCRQAVPLAEIEAYQIAQLVENMPEPKRSEIKLRFANAWHHFAEIGWFERLDQCADFAHEERQKVIVEYFFEGVPCPFLENEACAIHESRPMVCREYLVTSPAEHCLKPAAETIEMVNIPVKPSTTVRKITNSQNVTGAINFVPLILALEWAQRNADEFPEKTGEQWMADFFTNLTKSDIPSTN